MNSFMLAGKAVCIVLWLAILAAVAGVLPPLLNQFLPILGVLLLVAHAIECGLYLLRLRRPDDNVPLHLVQTLLFGMFHLSPRMKEPSA